jgi:cytochrome c2
MLPRSSEHPWAIVVGTAALAAAALFAAQGLQTHNQTIEVARTLTNGDSSRAPALIRHYGCSGCHTISGISGADGQVGGHLQDMRKRVYIAGVTPNTANNLVRWIVNPQAFSSQTAMPATGITESEARDIAAYLYER